MSEKPGSAADSAAVQVRGVPLASRGTCESAGSQLLTQVPFCGHALRGSVSLSIQSLSAGTNWRACQVPPFPCLAGPCRARPDQSEFPRRPSMHIHPSRNLIACLQAAGCAARRLISAGNCTHHDIGQLLQHARRSVALVSGVPPFLHTRV